VATEYRLKLLSWRGQGVCSHHQPPLARLSEAVVVFVVAEKTCFYWRSTLCNGAHRWTS